MGWDGPIFDHDDCHQGSWQMPHADMHGTRLSCHDFTSLEDGKDRLIERVFVWMHASKQPGWISTRVSTSQQTNIEHMLDRTRKRRQVRDTTLDWMVSGGPAQVDNLSDPGLRIGSPNVKLPTVCWHCVSRG